MSRTRVTAIAAALVAAWAAAATALTVEQKCYSGRAKAKTKYEECVGKWLAKLYSVYSPPDYNLVPLQAKLAKCRIKYAKAWDKLVALNTAPCSGNRYVDNGDGTVTDNLSGLMWEKKDDLDYAFNYGNPHDADNTYTWTSLSDGDGTDEDGMVFNDFLAILNAGGGFAGANGWRLPTFAELGTIFLPEDYPCVNSPCVPTAFNASCTAGCAATTCSCTRSYAPYWSATTWSAPSNTPPSTSAWALEFSDGFAVIYPKDPATYVRAVRGGL